MAAIDTVWRDRLLGYLDDQADRDRRRPGRARPDPECLWHRRGERDPAPDRASPGELGVEVDAWEIALSETLAADDFPGVEVDRTEAWGTVGRLPGAGDGQSLLLNAHVDVVPPGDLGTWGVAGPFGAAVRGDQVHGRGTCDMKAGLVASLWVVRAFAAVGVPLARRPAARHGDRGGGRRSGDVRPAAAGLACRRLRDPRADVVGHRPGLQRRADVPAHSARAGRARLPPAGRGQRDREVHPRIRCDPSASRRRATRSSTR